MSLELLSEEKIVSKVDAAVNILREDGGTDIDGTEIDSETSALRAFNERFKEDKKRRDLTDLFIMVEWFEKKGITDPLGEAVKLWNEDNNLGGSLPQDGAWIFSRFLFEKGVVLPRITSRPSYTRNVTLDWYQKWMPWVPEDKIHIHKEANSLNPDFKIDRINELGLRWFFEDSIPHALDIVYWTGATVILIPQPWNINFKPDNHRIIVCDGYVGQPGIIQAFFSFVDRVV